MRDKLLQHQKSNRMPEDGEHFDVAILGGGLAGACLARQLLLYSDKRVVIIDKRPELPAPGQKVGEATVQASAFYYSKVLDLEEHLLCDHFMKYNLRFYWKSAGRDNRNMEDFGQGYIRYLSNIASYQLDRNRIEAECLRLNLQNERFTLAAPTHDLDVQLASPGPHRLSFARSDGGTVNLTAEWVVDCSGRARILAHKMGLGRPGSIRHGSIFMWVDGLLNIEKLTDLPHLEMIRKKDRAYLGHLPTWLATNHFCGEGFWWWVIPLQGQTSLGLVFDRAMIDHRDVNTPEKLIAWVCREFPLFERDLPHRKINHFAGIPDYGYDCVQTISADKWAMAGMAGRFSDPLYSPGGDLISIYNTVITDAILTDSQEELSAKVRSYEQVMRAAYEAYVPSFADSYNVLGDQEGYCLKYTWELAIYFAFYVFPFINGFFTDRRFLPAFFNRFGRLGPINRNLQTFVSDYARWAKTGMTSPEEPIFHDFMELWPLAAAEKTFYKIGIEVDEAKQVLAEQLSNLEELARFTLAHLTSMVVGDEAVVNHQEFVESIDLNDYRFDPEALRQRWAMAGKPSGRYPWRLDPQATDKFRQARHLTPIGMGARMEAEAMAS